MSSEKPLKLFDLASQEPKTSWSFHVGKIRPVLAYKNIAYTTTWLDHNNLGPTLKELGVPPHAHAGELLPWTVPALRFSDGSITMNSSDIVIKIEALYPNPPLYIDNSLHIEAEQAVLGIFFPVAPVYMTRTVQEVVVPSALEAFKAPREQVLGMTFEELAKVPADQAWAGAKPGLDRLKEFLTSKKDSKGPYIRGSQISYADFVLIALIQSFKRCNEDFFDGMIDYDPCIKDLYDAMLPYLHRVD